ncbi:uncharacterized protein si:dkey-5i3.5 isoform X2 [Erpetoichthys calabaricus]|uniref:Si:dkey-5i3.5 n=1 Tax=Erpetoichthys calabaricus TaxID=27687 RepID=A0A8C4SWI3_ERPCA|nr:uncharacterized protein si:dkey-5i3.5 isoform X1 [Erpetoichthys calabaricus]XP_028670677.1 uncharacterized protein si:dkey-5i3.5 isoform X1 [Erpetoichthys calabaricus]XP_051786335.1 uncharacterized protein si:dkey-5i3.5 isoform X1 [Erpetoichthys calabaricus]XP_051786342.1 uncharacterized protein si:dkey-5i3.5 isoform X1 [Erpetoichthys calabaricus]XP_051786344.1 uncharacterized protein si:dkey-5i3.5 isoform X1 [Erpetoichthys calabaricus]XP_051786348.1 uncharacterized protein si:dkey-5i3.5 is
MQRAAINTGVKIQKISKTITFYKNEHKIISASSDLPKPLLLLLPWLGSQSKSVEKYREIYFKHGYDILTVESEVRHFLWPKWGLEYGAQVLGVLQSESFVSRPLLIHAFSIGGYTFAQMLLNASQTPELQESLKERIYGQIYDSLVVGTLEHMAAGIAKVLFPKVGGLVEKTTMLYFNLLKGYTVDYYNNAVDMFYDTPVTSPALFFYCENDPLSDHKAVEKLMQLWLEKQKITVVGKCWKNSVHAGHLRRHPKEYLDTLHSFLLTHGKMLPKAKL